MASPAEAREVAAIAVDDAERRLLERGLDPAAYARLLDALRRAGEQVVAAREHRLDVREYRERLDRVYAALEANPVADELPQPPRRTLALRW